MSDLSSDEEERPLRRSESLPWHSVCGLLIGAMSRSRVFLGGLVSTRARLRFPDCLQNAL